MVFRLTSLNSAFASAAVAAAALVTSATVAIAADSHVSTAEDMNGIFVPRKIAHRQGVDLIKEGVEQLHHLENGIKERIINGSTRPLRNNRKYFISPINDGGGDGDGDNIINRGALVNAFPTNTKGERRRKLADVDYCNGLCGYDRTVIPHDESIASLVRYCESSGNCGNCTGDGSDIDYRCPSQIKCWDTSEVTNMVDAFRDNTEFNEPLRCWDVSSVNSMSAMFFNAAAFNQPINNWDVSSVKDMAGLFHDAIAFNQPLQSWDVSSVENGLLMFYNATSFNQPLDVWDTSSFLDAKFMFNKASAFNQCISSWSAKLPSWTINREAQYMFTSTSCPTQIDIFNDGIQPFCQGSNEQCIATTCEDDPDFRFGGQDSKDCKWAALGDSTDNRCAKEGVLEGCAKTCNPVCFGACFDNPFFQLNGVKAKTCEWVAKQKTSERCKKPGVMDACRQTCKPICATAAVDCTDDQDFFLGGVKGKTCEWVAKQKTSERCKKPGVMAACRQTCNPSCGCTDSMEEFEFQGNKITCDDLDVDYCDAELISSGDEYFEQLQDMLDEVLISMHEQFDAVNQRLDAMEDIEDEVVDDAVVEEITTDSVLDRKTYGDVCPNKCKKCIDS